MKLIKQTFTVPFTYNTYFTEGLFKKDNQLFKQIIEATGGEFIKKLLFVIDSGVNEKHPNIQREILAYTNQYQEYMQLATAPIIVPGGEKSKNDHTSFEYILKEIDEYGICRHSFLVAIGGGAVLDMAGFAASIAHRGIQIIRIPTTVLGQNDSGVGVKSGINAFDKKNFIGTFKPPFAVINDHEFLETLHEKDWKSGISEAIKVALIKDKEFFKFIQQNTEKLNQRDKEAMQTLIFRCAELHLEHIAKGDPFEMGSSRPLDFGHWAAHKLEQVTKYKLRHGEAVAIGLALDVTYSYLTGLLDSEEWEEVLELLQMLGLPIYTSEMHAHLDDLKHNACILQGLEEFREHLGGELTIMLLEKIGQGTEVHAIDELTMKEAITLLKEKQTVSIVV